ncbi:MAG: Bax inhibitor-1/YccA family protein [Bacilli bacterium]|nr:Bax inhibitor-1/YccA family protein [Bacilli bacterium]
MENRIYSKMFNWLFIGLLITFISGYSLSLNETLLMNILSIGVFPIIIVELIIAFAMGFFIKKLSPLMTKIFYIIYSITTGVTFGTIFLAYRMDSIITIFLVAALLFGLLAFYGYKTKKDITKIGTLLFVALLASLIVSVLNVFIFKSSGLEFGLSLLIIIVFLGYVAYDMNNIKYLVNELDEDKAAVYGAFQLYLDFINIFIRLLELFGKRND